MADHSRRVLLRNTLAVVAAGVGMARWRVRSGLVSDSAVQNQMPVVRAATVVCVGRTPLAWLPGLRARLAGSADLMLHDGSSAVWFKCCRRLTGSGVLITVSAATDDDPSMLAPSTAAAARRAGVFSVAVLVVPSVFYDLPGFKDEAETRALHRRIERLRAAADRCLIPAAYYRRSPDFAVESVAGLVAAIGQGSAL